MMSFANIHILYMHVCIFIKKIKKNCILLTVWCKISICKYNNIDNLLINWKRMKNSNQYKMKINECWANWEICYFANLHWELTTNSLLTIFTIFTIFAGQLFQFSKFCSLHFQLIIKVCCLQGKCGQKFSSFSLYV